MTHALALTTGAGLGLAFFGGLWLTVHAFLRQVRSRLLLGGSQLVRFALVGLALYGLSREGPDMLLAGLAGLWLARCWVLREVGGKRHGK